MTMPDSTSDAPSHPARLARAARLAAAVLIACVGLAGPRPAAAELVDAELLDAELNRRVVRLASVGPDGLSYFNDRRELESTALVEIVRITPLGSPSDTPRPTHDTTDESRPTPRGLAASVTVVLTDGQRYAHAQWQPSNEPDAIALRHPVLGQVDLPLELVAEIKPARQINHAAAAPQQGEAIADTVVLINGDALDGFVERLGPNGVTLLPDVGDPITLALDRVASVHLVNPPQPEPIDEHRLALRDGSRLHGRALRLVSGSVLGEANGRLQLDARLPGVGWRAVGVALDNVDRVDLAGYRLVPLSGLELESQAPGPVFGVAWPPEPTEDGWLVHAPIVMAWRLPPGARRVDLRADLATGELTAAAAALADCVVRWTAAGADWAEELGTRRLIGLPYASAGYPTPARAPGVVRDLADDATTLRVEVDPGVNGPIADRVRLHGPGVLVVGSPGARSAY
ncbi:MAG: hypothetical protein AAF586_00895 [Planctomycetota bacterium]